VLLAGTTGTPRDLTILQILRYGADEAGAFGQSTEIDGQRTWAVHAA